MVTAYAIAGDLTFNPEKDTLIGADGKEVMLDSPFGDSLPQKGFDRGEPVCLCFISLSTQKSLLIFFQLMHDW